MTQIETQIHSLPKLIEVKSVNSPISIGILPVKEFESVEFYIKGKERILKLE